MDNKQNLNTDPNNNQNQIPIDKTFVEGMTSAGIPATPLKSGTKISSTSSQNATNPYLQSKTVVAKTFTGGALRPADSLPSGNEPIALGSGTIVGLLGTGGMARVYKIWNEKLEVFRAAKILLPNGQSDMKSRFETEAKITAKLHHPNIVEIYNVGDWNSLPYLEMEFIDGDSLESLIHKQGKLPDTVSCAIAIFIARALSYAHSQEFLIYGKNYHGVIHRDLKPANIMISKSGEVRLMDFGIARPTETSLHTVEGNIVGTMQYLSPEQMDGVDIDCRTDIYSFGAILYEMLTGTKTFPQDTITNLMKKKIMNDYRKFSDFDFEVSSILARISQKCLQINKNDRYSSAEMLLKDLENAFKSLSSDTPAKALKIYLANPDTATFSKKNHFKFLKSPKFLIPAAGLLLIATLLPILLLTGPKEPQLKKVDMVKSPSAVVATTSSATNQVTTPIIATSIDSGYHSLPNQSVHSQPVSISKPLPTTQKHTQPVNTLKQLPQTHQTVASINPKAIETQELTKQKPAEANISPIEKLKQKYNSDDLMNIGKTALRNGSSSDAITAFENIPDGGPDNLLKLLLLFDAYLDAGRTKDALYIANSQSPNDAQYDYLCGLLYEKLDKPKQSLDYYQNSLTKPSIVRNRNDIRNDALFRTAIIWSNQYKSNPNSDTRIQTLNAWNIVKRTYSSNPDNPRFKRANTELATIQ